MSTGLNEQYAITDGAMGTLCTKADVKTLQQLSSSGKGGQDKRQENHKERALGALDSAIKDHFQGGGYQKGSGKK